MVLVSKKREDADRKIVQRMQRDGIVLPPENSVFVLISSDLDFGGISAMMTAQGFRVIILFRPQDNAPDLETYLSTHASEVYAWSSVVGPEQEEPTAEALIEGEQAPTEAAAEEAGMTEPELVKCLSSWVSTQKGQAVKLGRLPHFYKDYPGSKDLLGQIGVSNFCLRNAGLTCTPSPQQSPPPSPASTQVR